MTNEPTSGNQAAFQAAFKGTVQDQEDFSSSNGLEHRKSVIATAALILVLALAQPGNPEVLGVTVPVPLLWVCLTLAHVYFFTMWRITAPIENDQDKRFWNIQGILRQSVAGGTAQFPGKTKAQIWFIRALPIWAFGSGIVGIIIGLLIWFYSPSSGIACSSMLLP